jgi:hypothetical protein
MLVGAVCGFIVYVIILVPLFGAMNALAVVDPELKDGNFGNNEIIEYIEVAATVSDAFSNNAGSLTIRAMGGNLLYRGITTQIMDGRFVSLERELNFVSDAVSAAGAVFNQDLTYAERAEKLRALPKSFDKTDICRYSFPRPRTRP